MLQNAIFWFIRVNFRYADNFRSLCDMNFNAYGHVWQLLWVWTERDFRWPDLWLGIQGRIRGRGQQNAAHRASKYSILKPVYIVAFLNYRIMTSWNVSVEHEQHRVLLFLHRKRTGEAAPPTISIIFAELERFTKSERECKTDRDWLFYIFKHSSSLIDIPEAIREKPFFNQLLEACRIAAFDEQKKTKYEKAMLDERDILEIKDYAFEQGLEKERQRKGRRIGWGKKEAVNETAKAMLADGMPVETVAKYTGLTAEMIGNLA